MRGGPQKPQYRIPKDPDAKYVHIVMVGTTKYQFDTKEEAEAFHYFLKHGVKIELALAEVKRLKDRGELTSTDADTGTSTGTSGYPPY